MKKVLLLFCFVLLGSVTAGADAVYFESAHQDWNGIIMKDVNCTSLSGKEGASDDSILGDGLYTYSYNLTVSFNPSADEINSAILHLTHYGNIGNGSLWIIKDGVKLTDIGVLSDSNTTWLTQDFVLSSSLYSLIQGSTWTLGLTLAEGSKGMDKIYIDQSWLTGTYTPAPTAAPLPASIFLLAPGVLGLIGLKKKGRMLNAC
jgi:hypothetical protein